jgi:hypothetical protein
VLTGHYVTGESTFNPLAEKIIIDGKLVLKYTLNITSVIFHF